MTIDETKAAIKQQYPWLEAIGNSEVRLYVRGKSDYVYLVYVSHGHAQKFADAVNSAIAADHSRLEAENKRLRTGQLEIRPAVRELLCQRCEQDYPVWFAPNDIWQRVRHSGEHFLCPTCFTVLAEQRGLVPTGWLVRPEAISDGNVARLTAALKKIAALEPWRYPDAGSGFRAMQDIAKTALAEQGGQE